MNKFIFSEFHFPLGPEERADNWDQGIWWVHLLSNRSLVTKVNNVFTLKILTLKTFCFLKSITTVFHGQYMWSIFSFWWQLKILPPSFHTCIHPHPPFHHCTPVFSYPTNSLGPLIVPCQNVIWVELPPPPHSLPVEKNCEQFIILQCIVESNKFYHFRPFQFYPSLKSLSISLHIFWRRTHASWDLLPSSEWLHVNVLLKNGFRMSLKYFKAYHWKNLNLTLILPAEYPI